MSARNSFSPMRAPIQPSPGCDTATSSPAGSACTWTPLPIEMRLPGNMIGSLFGAMAARQSRSREISSSSCAASISASTRTKARVRSGVTPYSMFCIQFSVALGLGGCPAEKRLAQGIPPLASRINHPCSATPRVGFVAEATLGQELVRGVPQSSGALPRVV